MDAGPRMPFYLSPCSVSSTQTPLKIASTKQVVSLPSLLAELTAIRYGLHALTPILRRAPGGAILHLYTDSTAAMRDLCRVSNNCAISRDIHTLLYTCPCPLRLLWIRRNTLRARIEADRDRHPMFIHRLLPMLTTGPLEYFLKRKEDLRRATCPVVLIYGTDYPNRLARWLEALLRRLSAGVGLSQAVTPRMATTIPWPVRWRLTLLHSSCRTS